MTIGKTDHRLAGVHSGCECVIVGIVRILADTNVETDEISLKRRSEYSVDSMDYSQRWLEKELEDQSEECLHSRLGHGKLAKQGSRLIQEMRVSKRQHHVVTICRDEDIIVRRPRLNEVLRFDHRGDFRTVLCLPRGHRVDRQTRPIHRPVWFRVSPIDDVGLENVENVTRIMHIDHKTTTR